MERVVILKCTFTDGRDEYVLMACPRTLFPGRRIDFEEKSDTIIPRGRNNETGECVRRG